MAFGRRKTNESAIASAEGSRPIETYDVIYRGGLPELPKAKTGKIIMEIHSDRFLLKPTTGSKGFWNELAIPYSETSGVEIVERNVSTFEALAGGINSRQLNQKNNIHITFSGSAGPVQLRLEMLSGVTVMGQAKKCAEFEDRLRNFHIREQFSSSLASAPPASTGNLADELGKLASLREQGLLSEEEFISAKARLLEG